MMALTRFAAANSFATPSLTAEAVSASGRWWLWGPLGCLAILLATTVSAPDADDISRDAFNPILPVAILKWGRMAGRLAVLASLVYLLYLQVNHVRLWLSAALIAPLLAYVGLGVLSVSWSPLPWISLIQSLSFAILILFAWLIGATWSGERDTSRLLGAITFLFGGAAGGLLCLWYLRPDVGALAKGSVGIFHSTAAGAMSSLSILLIFSSWLLWGWRWTYWAWLLLPFHVACLAIGGNRFSIVALSAAAGFLFLIAAPRRQAAWAVVAGCGAVLLYFIADPGLVGFDRLFAYFAELLSHGQSQQQLHTLSGRTEMWEAMWRSYWDSPIWGHGYFVSSAAGELYMWDDWGNWTAHSVFLQSLVSLGLLGTTLLFGGLLLIGGNLALRFDDAASSHGRHVQLLLAFATWFLVWGLINESFLGVMQPESIVFAVALGLAVAVCGTEADGSAREASGETSGNGSAAGCCFERPAGRCLS